MPGITEVRVERHIIRRGDEQHGYKYRVRIRGESETFDTLDDAQLFRDDKLGKVKAQRNALVLGPAYAAKGLKVTAIDGEKQTAVQARIGELFDWFEEDTLSDENDGLAPATRRSYRESLVQFRKFFVKRFHNPLISAIKTRDVKAFAKWRQKQSVSRRTVQKDVVVLHRVFDTAIEDEQFGVDTNPVRLRLAKIIGKTTKRVPKILNDKEFELLVAMCGDDLLRVYVTLLGESALRDESEALWLMKEDIDLEEGFLHVVSGRGGHFTKSRKPRMVPISKALHKALTEYLALPGPITPWLFHHRVNRRHHKAGGRIRSLRRAVKNAAKLAGIPHNWHLHDLRHRRITIWRRNGMPLPLIQMAAGQVDPHTTDGYTWFDKADLKRLIEEPVTVGQ